MMRFAPAVVFVVGLVAVVAAVTLTVGRGPFDRTPVGSEYFYWQSAGQAAAGKLQPADLAGAPSPLYPHLLSPLASSKRNAAKRARRILTVVLLSLTGLGVFAVARKHAGPWAATAAGLAAAATGPVVWNAGAFSPALPAGLVGLLALLLLDRWRSLPIWFVAGILVGIAGRLSPALGWSLGGLLVLVALFRPSLTPEKQTLFLRVLAVFLFALAWLGAGSGTAKLVGSGGLLPPVTGTDMYRGHRAGASGVQPRRGDRDALRWWTPADYVLEASRKENRLLTEHEANKFWAARAATEWVSHPVAGLRRAGVKLLAGFQGDPAPREVSCAFVADRTDRPGLPAVVWLGRILLPLGLAGLVLQRRRAGLLWVGALSGLGAACLTFAGPEARQLTVLSLAAGLAFFVETLARGTNRKRAFAVVAGAAAVALWGLWPAYGGVPGQEIQGDDFFQLGSLYDHEGRGSAAMSQFERAARRDPTNPYPRYGLAMMLVRDNVLDEAARELEMLRRRHPDFRPGLRLLARVYEHQQKWTRAASVYVDLVRINPFSPELFNNLGTMYVKIGYYDQARAALETALRLQPDYQVARDNLEGLRAQGLAPGAPDEADPYLAAQDRIVDLVRAEEFAAAEDSLRAAMRTYGADRPELIALEGTLLLAEKKPEEAVRRFESVRAKLGKNPLFLNNLAAAYAQAGKREKARAVWKEALAIQPDNERIRRSLAQVQAEIDSVAAAGR